MLKFLLHKMSWKSFAMGAATSVVGGAVVHPLLVSVAKVGMGVASATQDVIRQASTEMARVRDEAAQSRASSFSSQALLEELRALRSDLAAVKAKAGLA